MCNSASASKKRYGEIAALFLACGAAIYFLSIVFVPNLTRLTHGFISYYTLAQLAREGEADARIYDDTWFRAQTVRISGGAASDILNANPPALVFLLLPLMLGAPETARMLWAGLNALALGGVLVLLARVSQLPRVRALLLGAFCLVAAPVAENFRLGQAYVLLLFLFTLSLFLWQREQDFAGGAALGTAAVLKTAGAFLWLMFLARRETRVLVGGIFTAMVGILLSLPLVGADTWRAYLLFALPAFADNPEHALTAYQTLSSFLQHWFRYDARLNAFPMWDAPWLARGLWLTSILVLSGISLYLTRAFPKARAFAVFVTLSVILAPVAEEHHFALLVLPVFVFAATIENPRDKSFWIFLVALVLVALPFPYKASELAVGWSALLAYPRLYGALLLWSLLVFKK